MTKMPSQPTEYNIKAMSPMTPYGSFDNQENADVLAMPASDVQSDNLSFKRQGIDLLVMPCLLNDKLSLWAARSVSWSAVR